MRKYISLFEEYDSSGIKDMTSESAGGWVDIRNRVQQLKPFTIISFKEDESYSRFLDGLDTDYIKQDYYHDHIGDNEPHMKLPSIFIPKAKIDIFGSTDPFDEYDVFCMYYNKEDVITARFEEEELVMGNELVSALSSNEVDSEDYFKIGSTFYKFINFLG